MKNLLQQYLFTFITDELKPEITIPSGSQLLNTIEVPKSNVIGNSELFVYRIKKVKNAPDHIIGGSLTEPNLFSLALKEDVKGVPVYKMVVHEDHFTLHPITKEMLSKYDTGELEENHLRRELDRVFVSHKGYRGSRIVKKGKRIKCVKIQFEWDRNKLKPDSIYHVQQDAAYMIDLTKDILKYVSNPQLVQARHENLHLYTVNLDYDKVIEIHGRMPEEK